MIKMSFCRSCGAEICWVKTQSGKRMPCDITASVTDYEGKKVVVLVPHFATCPQAYEWSKKPEKKKED